MRKYYEKVDIKVVALEENLIATSADNIIEDDWLESWLE